MVFFKWALQTPLVTQQFSLAFSQMNILPPAHHC